MKLIVNPHKIILDKEETVNEKEINISKCTFEFADEITDDFVKEAYFTYKGESYKKIIANNECTFPQEVLQEEGTVEVGVVAYLVEDEEEITRYNPSPIWFKTDKGSLKQAKNSEEPTPSEMEQYEQILQDGLTLVNEKLEDIDTAITETNNLDLDANKVGNTTTVEITKKDGTSKTVNILDGVDGLDGSDGITPTIGNNGNWYIGDTDTGKPSRGEQGPTGQTGATGPAGRDGVDGTNGADGYSPSASVSKTGDTATITITDKGGTTTATITDGQDGQDGVGIPSGGTQGQVLSKINSTDYNTEWVNIPTPDLSNYLAKNNTTEYTPTGDYNPSTKLYVDSKINPTVETSSTSTYTIAQLNANYVYKLGLIEGVTITAVSVFNKESIIYFTSGVTPTAISVPTTLTNLGDVPTLTASGGVSTGTCDASKSYIISVLNGIAIWKKY